ncbi:peptidylprolyl isomerase [Mitsuokella multacida]|uniref:Peptidyl-prolyl cis-trans isomerase n=1 Tax=Mitsuokella multacida DSM 20544 TaxID=500635 RepID=C9KJ17_9FIRM|nr:peptidylprolyl isomerase [Mitsuokella multacida]EEX69883.1 peptidyl-prolyl cis-trans isomerase, cyclophilin-type [Mitsuokella multacida DSM 20544]
MKKVFLLLLAMVLMTGSCLAASGNASGNERTTSVQDGPAVKDVHKDVHKGDKKMVNRIAVFETNLGNFSVELFEDETPITTENFIDLAEKGFYDGVIFHRVIDGFMIQGGDPEGTGMGGPGYTIEDEFRDDLRFDGEGILAMANTGMPHTGGSQFFITLDKTPWLNGHHTIFGKVKEGMDVVRRIGHSETDMADRPLEDVVIKTIEIKYPE